MKTLCVLTLACLVAVPAFAQAPASPPAAAAPGAADIHAKLTELKKLFDDGLITASEYADGKKDILSRL